METKKIIKFLKNLKNLKSNVTKVDLDFECGLFMRFKGCIKYQEIKIEALFDSDEFLTISENFSENLYSVEIEDLKKSLIKFKNKKITIECLEEEEKISIHSDCGLKILLSYEKKEDNENENEQNQKYLYVVEKKTEDLQKIFSFVLEKQGSETIDSMSFGEFSKNYITATDGKSLIFIGDMDVENGENKFYIQKNYIKLILEMLKNEKKESFNIFVKENTISLYFEKSIFLNITRYNVRFPRWKEVVSKKTESNAIEIKDFNSIKEITNFYYETKNKEKNFDFVFKDGFFKIFFEQKEIFEQETNSPFLDKKIKINSNDLREKEILENKVYFEIKESQEGVLHIYGKNNTYYLLTGMVEK